MADREHNTLVLRELYVYPVKSCSPVQVDSWDVIKTGFKYDRLWMIVDENGVFMSLRRVKSMYWIKPSFDFDNNLLCLDYENLPTLKLPLESQGSQNIVNCKLFKKSIVGYDCGPEASNWLEEVFQESGYKLVRQTSTIRNGGYNINNRSEELAYVDSSQYLMLCEPSLAWLANQLNDQYDLAPEDPDYWTVSKLKYRFRPNFFVTGSAKEFEEESWTEICFGDIRMKVHEPCERCEIINVCNDETAYSGLEPRKILSKLRKAPVSFGIYMGKISDSDSTIQVGCKIEVK